MADIIDFHTHVFPDDLASRAVSTLIESAPGVRSHTDGTLSGLVASMDRYGIPLAVTLPVATKPSQVRPINSGLSSADGRIVPFGTLHPALENIDGEIGRLAAAGVKGVKFHPEYQNFYIDDARLGPVYEALSDSGLIAVFHAGKDPGPFTGDHALPAAIRTVCRNHPSLILVAAHFGGWMVWADVERYLVSENLYFDTAALDGWLQERDFVRLCRRHGVSRILFGSDSPWFDQGESMRWIERTGLTDGEKEKILSGNARNLLGLR